MRTAIYLSLVLTFVSFTGTVGADVDWYASEVVSSSVLGASPYDFAGAVLGKPTTQFKEPGALGETWSCSMVAGAWNLAPPPYNPQDPNSGKIITTINPGGSIVVKFATPIEDDPQNWYGLDFIVYGNSGFNSTSEEYVTSTSDMEQCFIDDGSGRWEPSMVSVAQYPNGPWYDYSLPTDPRADAFAPLQAFAWDNISHVWGAELDFTKPIDPALIPDDFASLSVLQAIDLYKGSAGGAAFDISRFALPTNQSGRKWIQYIKVMGSRGEVDAFSSVGHVAAPKSIHDAKALGDLTPVIIDNAIVTAGVSDLGDCCYAQVSVTACGIKLKGRALARGQLVKVYGVMGTDGDERVLNVTAIEPSDSDNVTPFGMANRSIGGGDQKDSTSGAVAQSGVRGGRGPNTVGLLVRTWGRVSSRNTTARTWLVDDGSGCPVKCVAPPDPEFVLPDPNAIVAVTGVCSCERNPSNELIPVIRLRDQQDLN